MIHGPIIRVLKVLEQHPARRANVLDTRGGFPET